MNWELVTRILSRKVLISQRAGHGMTGRENGRMRRFWDGYKHVDFFPLPTQSGLYIDTLASFLCRKVYLANNCSDVQRTAAPKARSYSKLRCEATASTCDTNTARPTKTKTVKP
jgi:hypothetical protein